MNKISYDYSILRGRIVEKYGSIKNFCKENNNIMSNVSLSCKLNNKVSFKQDEISDIAEVLGIPFPLYHDYFFCLKSKEN